MDCSPPGSSAHGIFQAWILEWVAISFSRGSSQPRDRTRVSCIIGRRFTVWATRGAHRTPLSIVKYPNPFPYFIFIAQCDIIRPGDGELSVTEGEVLVEDSGSAQLFRQGERDSSGSWPLKVTTEDGSPWNDTPSCLPNESQEGFFRKRLL